MTSGQFFIFDADGVLLNSLAKACSVFNEIVEERFPNLPYVSSQEDMAYVYPGPLKTSFRRFGLSDEETADFFNYHSARMREEAESIEPFFDVIASISTSLAGRCAIVSSSYVETIETVLSKASQFDSKIFTHIMGRDVKKTKTEKIHYLLSEIGLSNTNAIYVGDMVSDILYCKDVPIKIASVGFGYQPANYLAAFCPDKLLPTTTALNAFMQCC